MLIGSTVMNGAWAQSSGVQPTLPAGFHESIVFGGLTAPTAVRFASNGQVFVAEKSGLIKVFSGLDDPSPTIFANLRTAVHNYWDRGLLGLELDPDYPARPYVYVLYTYDFDPNTPTQIPRWGMVGAASDGCPTPPGPTTDGCVVVGRLSRLTATGSPPVMSSEVVLVQDWCQQFPSHSVGSLRFGADGALYASGGDGASFTFVDYGQTGVPRNPCGDPPVPVGGTQSSPSAEGGALRSQDLQTSADPASLNGTVIRIDPNTGAAWPTNPLVSSADPNARRILAYGLRNPFRFALRPGTREVWIGDVGWNDWEEINVISDANDAVVENFGWPCYEGSTQQAGYSAADLTLCKNLYAQPASVTHPFFAYRHSSQLIPGENCPSGSSSLSGLAFEFLTSGGSYPPEYANALFFADYARNCIWVMFAGANGRPNPTSLKTFVGGASGPVDLQIGPGGEVFYVDFNGGTLRRIEYLGANHPPIAVANASPTSGPPPLTVQFDGRSSSDPDGDAIIFDWDLDGDGAFDDSTSPTPAHTYTTAGAFNVGLKVTDSRGTSTVTTITITAQQTNLALNRPATASSTQGAGFEAAKAVDGNVGTRWSSQFSDPQWLMVDLGAMFTISGVKLSWEAAYAKAYRIEVSPDAVGWTTVYSTTTGDGGVDNVTGLSATGRYVRVFGTARGSPYGYSLWEVDVYGVAAKNAQPVATIATPGSAVTWRVGDVIAFSGSATDPEDGALPASALSWSLVLQHCPSTCHTHALQSWQGVSNGSFTAPDHDYPSHLELTLTATDSGGVTGKSVVRLNPKTAALGIQTSPSQLQITIDGAPVTTPFSRTVILGSAHSISAPSPQTSGGETYNFVSWSDGGARTHNIVANASTTYTATFAGSPPVISNVRALGITSAAAKISWTTNEVATSQVESGTSTALGSITPLTSALVTSHSVRLTGLRANTLYHYRVLSRDAAGNQAVSGVFTFLTKK